MTTHDQQKLGEPDPLGLRNLDVIEPGYDGWTEIQSALETQRKWNMQKSAGWLAAAASLVLVISVVLFNTQNNTTVTPGSHRFATSETNPASIEMNDNINALIGMSQVMEEQVMSLRQEAISMPAESAIYVAELEDLIAQVDNELSLTPDSIDLWGHRVNLLLDLAQIYQQQLEIDYGRMASL
jgi:hypothetical protein